MQFNASTVLAILPTPALSRLHAPTMLAAPAPRLLRNRSATFRDIIKLQKNRTRSPHSRFRNLRLSAAICGYLRLSARNINFKKKRNRCCGCSSEIRSYPESSVAIRSYPHQKLTSKKCALRLCGDQSLKLESNPNQSSIKLEFPEIKLNQTKSN
jgi:hypothetical protein